MPKPPGTYRHIRKMGRIRARARADRVTVATARNADLVEFSRAVEKVDIEELESWHRFMVELRDGIERGESMSTGDRRRRQVGEIVREIRGMFEKVQDYRMIESALQAPVRPIIRAPSTATTALPTIIALCALLEVLVRTVRIRRDDRGDARSPVR